MNRIFQFYKAHEIKLWIAFFVGFSLLIALSRTEPEPAPVGPLEAEDGVATLIPEGHLLIPIELRNAAQLDGLLASTGIVDLYQAPSEGQRDGRLVGRRLRLMRAPLNPQSFAILVRETEADRILSFPGPFTASLRSKSSAPHVVSQASARPRIEYQTEVR